MAFHDVRVNENIERGARGGPMFKTTVIELSNGGEQRNIDWSKTRHYWDIAYGVMDREDYEEIRTFFYNRRGRAHTFRFRDWTDYQLSEELIATADASGETEFQVTKTYTGLLPYVREIRRPVADGFVVKVNGVAVSYTMLDKGIVQLSVAPAEGDLITVTGLFDIEMRFDVDKFELEPTWSEAASTGGLPVIEVRPRET